jgi:hypothetical protein
MDSSTAFYQEDGKETKNLPKDLHQEHARKMIEPKND